MGPATGRNVTVRGSNDSGIHRRGVLAEHFVQFADLGENSVDGGLEIDPGDRELLDDRIP